MRCCCPTTSSWRRTRATARRWRRRGPWATTERRHTTWYQPLEAQADIDRAVHWALGTLPSVHLNTAGDLTLLPKVLEAADRLERRPSDEAMAEMLKTERMTSLFGLPT